MSAAVIDLPPVNGLSEQQVRGTACVWCGVALAPATAIDLGARPAQFAGSDISWFPRGCRPCAATEIYKEYVEHLAKCRACSARGGLCSAGASLRAALKLARR